MTTRDFDSMLAERSRITPTFTVAGQEFTLRRKLPFRRWNRLLSTMRADDVDPQVATAEFFNTVLIKADRQRFLDLMNKEESDDDDDEDLIDMSQLDAITDWAVEHFTGKLPSSTSSSPPGANGTGAAPNMVSLQSRTTTT